MSELVERLRKLSKNGDDVPTDWLGEAADTIERLEATFNQRCATVACKCGYGVAVKAWDERGATIDELGALNERYRKALEDIANDTAEALDGLQN